MVAVKTAEFSKASAVALKNAPLQRTMGRVMQHFNEARETAVREVTEPTWEHLRSQAAAIKAHSMVNLDYYLEMVDDTVTRNGGHVHFAQDVQEANRIVLEIARQNQVKRAIKGKSMVSEELGLNEALKAAEIEAVETDLGEYIIQLAHETPFHIIAPAMHKSRQEVSDLFQQWLKTAPTGDIQELCRIARVTLREVFPAADMGISGANFVVAETGTVVLVTNEGNGRMVTSMPRVYVAIAGMEKVIPALEDVAVFLRLLSRSATGQRITSYTTFAGGPRAQGEVDGPEEFHLVIVDNGRMEMLKDETVREALHCIRCGACSNVCPVYRNVGGHAYGWVYSGPIGAVITPLMVGLKEAKELPFASTLCGACRDVCPVKIDLPRLLLRLRHKVAEGDSANGPSTGWLERLMVRRWSAMMGSRNALARCARLGRLMQRPWVRRGRIRRLPLPLVSKWTRERDLPALAPESFRKRWGKQLTSRGGPRP